MRQSDRMIVTTCQLPLSQGKRYVVLHLLTKERLYCVVEPKTKVQDILEQLGNYIGIKDIFLFGLAILSDNEYTFLNQDIKLSKYAPKQWKVQNSKGSDGNREPLLTMYLRIQFYVDCHLLLREKITRYHYYLQLRENLLNYQHRCSEELYFLLASYCLQADEGNYIQEKHVGQYFEPNEYFPLHMVQSISKEYIIRNMPSMHKDASGLTRGEAQLSFIQEASHLTTPFNIHLFKLLTKKNDPKNFIWLGICSKGIELYLQKSDGFIELLTSFLWSNIKKLCFEKKKFEIRVACYPDIRKYTYYANNDDKAKHLLHLCKITHQLTMALEPKIAELKVHEQNAKQVYRESYIYSDSYDLEWEQEHGSINMTFKDFGTLPKSSMNHKDQRISVISNASSNTTSGIVSDKVQSLDGSEDDLELEVLIRDTCAESTESLPVAMPLDKEWELYPSYRPSSANNYSFNDEKIHLPSLQHRVSKANVTNSHLQQTTSSNSVNEARLNTSFSHNNLFAVQCHSEHVANNSTPDRSDSPESNVPSKNCSFLNNSKDFRMSLSLDSLPKLEQLHPTFHEHHLSPKMYSSNIGSLNRNRFVGSQDLHYTSQLVPVTEDTKSQFEVTNNGYEAKIHLPPVTSNSRILTNVRVQAPLVIPSSLTFNPPQNRTKIGISSLSRPTQHEPVMNAKKNFVTSAGQSLQPSTSKNLAFQLPPTPMHNPHNSVYIPKYEPVLGNSVNDCKNFEAFKISLEDISSKTCEENFRMSLVPSDNNLDFTKFESSDIFIPPPPLYANSTSCVNSRRLNVEKVGNAENGICKRNCENLGSVADISSIVSNGQSSISAREPFCVQTLSPETLHARTKLKALNDIDVDLNLDDSFSNMDERCLTELITPSPPLQIGDMQCPSVLNLSSSSSSTISPNFDSSCNSDHSPSPPLNIDILRKRSKDLDLPLITALCNDRSLIPASEIPRRASTSEVPPPLSRPFSWHLSSDIPLQISSDSPFVNKEMPWHHACNHSLPSSKSTFQTAILTKASSATCLSRHYLNQVEMVAGSRANANNVNNVYNHFDVSVS